MTTRRRLVVGPFNRVEGDLEVRLDVADARVRKAWVNAPMYRGFEQILPGRDPLDALVYVPRICGICSVSQSVAAVEALERLCDVQVPANGRHCRNVIAAVENAADHLSHFYLFFMPDFAREVYASEPWHASVHADFAAGSGAACRDAIAARQRWLQIVGLLGGKWPHTQSVVVGGSARGVDLSEQSRLLSLVREFRRFLERRLFAGALDAVLAIDHPDALRQWCQARPQADFSRFLRLADALSLQHLGAGPGRYLSFGGFAGHEAPALFRAGVYHAGFNALDLAAITEDLSSARYRDDVPRHPAQGQTEPDADKPGAYSWNKAPRYAGQVVETGALARAMVNADPLILAETAAFGGNVCSRVLARLLELARLTQAIETWVQAIVPGRPFFALPRGPLADADAVGTHEAARGALGHWLSVRRGRIAHYQIVAPTSWNFSPRDGAGVPGALEAALVGTPVGDGETTPVAVQHVVRSFDPCMVCTVH